MRGFILGLVAGAVIGAGGFWAYFATGGTIQEFAEMRCWIAMAGQSEQGAPVYRSPDEPVGTDAQITGAAELVGPDKAARAVDLCRLILE